MIWTGNKKRVVFYGFILGLSGSELLEIFCLEVFRQRQTIKKGFAPVVGISKRREYDEE